MEIFDYKLLGLDKIGINSNILETGLINIILLVGLLLYFKDDFLENVLEKRRLTIANRIQKAEDEFIEAVKCFKEKKKKLDNFYLTSNKIKNETNLVKQKLSDSNIKIFENNLDVLFNKALFKYYLTKQKVHSEVHQKIIYLVLERLKLRYSLKENKNEYKTILIDRIIKQFDNNLFYD